MTDTVIISLISLGGTLFGSLSGILVSNKLVNFRIERLEEQVKTHNAIVERTYKLEGQMVEVQHDIKGLKAR